MRILFFGSYNPEYSRNRVLIRGLKENGVEIIECNDRSRGLIKFCRLIVKYLKSDKEYDFMLVPFPGQEIMLLARILTRKPIIFDAFTSHYGGYILDRQKFAKISLHSLWYRFLDRISCSLADLVLLDTNAHINFFVDEFGIERKKFLPLFVGTDTNIFKPMHHKQDRFTVHFHGNFIPLQGVEYIILAANILKDEDIVFNIIGRGQTYKHDRNLAESLNLKNINFLEPVSYEKLAELINSADVCLGIFGKTQKASLVIPNKVFEAAASAKAIITGESPAITELFTDGKDIVLTKMGDPKDLAEKLLLLKNDSDKIQYLGQNARDTILNSATEKIITTKLINKLEEI